METVQWLTSQVISLAGSFFFNSIGNAITYGLIGLMIGGFGMYFLTKYGWMKRPNKTWNTISKFQYALIPFLLMCLFGSFGAVRGVENTLNGWVDTSSTELKAYANGYIPQAQSIAEKFSASAVKSEDQLRHLILENAGLDNQSWAQDLYVSVNKAIIAYFLSQLGLENNANGIMALSKPGNIAKLSDSSFDGFSASIKHSFIGTYAAAFYWGIALFFLPFLLISAADFMALAINNKAKPMVARGVERIQKTPYRGRDMDIE